MILIFLKLIMILMFQVDGKPQTLIFAAMELTVPTGIQTIRFIWYFLLLWMPIKNIRIAFPSTPRANGELADSDISQIDYDFNVLGGLES